MSGDGGSFSARPAPLRVRGGSAGMAVGLDALGRAVGVLADAAGEVTRLGWRVAGAAADADVVAGSALSPVTGAYVEAALADVAGPRGVAGDATALLSLATALTAATRSYRRAEALASAGVEAAQDCVMFAVGGLAPAVVVGVLTLDAVGVDVVALLDETVFDHPALADLAGGAEGLVLGLRSNPLTAPLVPAPRRSDGLAFEQGYELGVRTLVDSATLWGLLSDRGHARVSMEPRPRTGACAPRTLADLAADEANVSDGEHYPGHVRIIEVPQEQGSAWIVEISGTQVWDPRAGANPHDPTTDAHAVAQDATVLADGVEQALAQAQAASAGSVTVAAPSPSPSAAAVTVRSAAASAVAVSSPAVTAPTDRQNRPGEEPSAPAPPRAGPVMLVGHSLGGIAAAGLASSPQFTREQQVTHVVTMGSPVGRMPVPADTQVLSLEHTQDAVPRLDGQPNPDRSTWVTVGRDLEGTGPDRASEAHSGSRYTETAADVDASTDPSVMSWRASSEGFFAGDTYGTPVVRDYSIERVVP